MQYYSIRTTVCESAIGKLTLAKIAEHVVALLRERDFIDRMSYVACLQQVVGVFASVSTIGETLHVTV